MTIEIGTPTPVVRIEKKVSYSEVDDFLNNTPYSLNLKVADEEFYASFIVYETVGSEYLNIFAAELRTNI
ncbi:hypothetical protein S83_028322 [Arachis hypogaea]